jgi:Tol biopolymer transport system component
LEGTLSINYFLLTVLIGMLQISAGESHHHDRTQRKALDSALKAPLNALSQVHAVTDTGDYLAPLWSPDGDRIAFTSDQYNGLFLLDLVSRNVRRLIDDPFSGYMPQWSRDGQQLAFRRPGQEFTAELDQAITIDGDRVPVVRKRSGFRLTVIKDEIFIEDEGGLRKISGGEDRFFAPVLSPDGSALVYQGLINGIYHMDLITGEATLIGRGNNPTWSPDGSAILFDRTEDDGYRLTSGELFMYRLEDSSLIQLTDTDEAIEQRPVFSPDGEWVAFDRDGAIYIGRMNN